MSVSPRRCVMGFIVVLWLCCWCPVSESRAELNPEINNAYQVRIVLSVGEHRMLTPAFQKQLENDLKAQLQLAFGNLARVEVVRNHPLLNAIRVKGLQPVLGEWSELSDWQTVFVLVDFVDGRYRIVMGQHDGWTGLSSPVVRQQALGNGSSVAATVVHMIHTDFAFDGTVGQVAINRVEVVLKGGALKSWVKKGDVFAVSRMTQEGPTLRATRIEWAVLQATDEPRDGKVSCKYFHRYREDQLTAEPPTVGFRCVKLITARGPVRLRLVDEKTQEFLSGLEIHVSGDGSFAGKPQGATVNGFFSSSKDFHGVAYVRVRSGDSNLVQFPIEIVDDRVAVVRMSPNPKAVARGEVEERRERWVRWLYEALAVATQNFQELNVVAITPLNMAASLETAKKSHQAMSDEIARLSKELLQLRGLALKDAPGLDLSEGDQLLKVLTLKKDQLQEFLTKLDQALQEKNSPETLGLQASLQQAKLLEQQADFDKAIQLYEAVLKAKPSQEVQAHLNQLKTAWAVKSPSHAKAREFIYLEWPGLDLAGVRANIAKAKEMLEHCQSVGDRKTPLKLLQVNVQHADALAKRINVLKRAPDTEDNRNELKVLVELVPVLRALRDQAREWLATDKK